MTKDFDFARRELEANEEDVAVAWAENNGWEVRKMKYIGRRGCADRFYFGPDERIVMIEFKGPKTPVEESQTREHKRLAKVGCTVHVCRTAAHAIEILRGFMQ